MSETFFNPERSDEDLISEWYNNALMGDPAEAANNLRKIQEVILHKNPQLLPEFFSNMLDFVTSKDNDVKKALVGFIEEACKLNESLIPKVTMSLLILLNEGTIAIQKRVVQASITLYRKLLVMICAATAVTEELEQAWLQMGEIKSKITELIDSDNDGVRTSVVKFLECVVLLQSYPDPHEHGKTDFTLESIPLTLKIARRRKLEEEANAIFDELIKFNGSSHISNANLFVCIGALTNIAKNRPDFMGLVVGALVSLGSNLPPTLSTTQVSSVRKKLKSEMTNLIKHPAAYDFLDKITPRLLELGCSQQEIAKAIPKLDEKRKYAKRGILPEAGGESDAKKAKLDLDLGKDDDVYTKQQKAIALNEILLKEKLTPPVTAEIVLKGLGDLPTKMPSSFKTDYNEALARGGAGEPKTVCRFMAEYFMEAGIGPGSTIIGKTTLIKGKKDVVDVVPKKRTRDEDDDEKELLPIVKKKVKVPRVKILKLHEITRPLDRNVKESLLVGAVKRLLYANNNNKQIHQKIITIVAASFNDIVRETVMDFVVDNLKLYLDLALAWLYEEYSIMQGFSRLPELRKLSRIEHCYNTLLTSCVAAAVNDSQLINRLILEAPTITDHVLNQLKQICKEEESCIWASSLLRELIMRRPTKQITFLNALLENITYENQLVRDCTVNHIVELHKFVEIRQHIEEHVKKCLEYLAEPTPPDCMFGFAQGRLQGVEIWNEDISRACLEGYVALLPSNQSLIHDLARVYVKTGADIKRVILRLLENPIRAMGMESMELLKLVQECPKGAETLVTRVIHVLTDKGPPSAQLVKRVRELYNTRVSDVRFLIPVLNGLSKQEIIQALPKLIKLNPVVVREVFNRLLGAHGECSISPTELLVALHIITTEQADIKTQMKAITMCLNEKNVFNQEVLAVVLQQLMEQTPLPTLLMRTVIQALGLFPRLSGFVMNLLQRLILKQVWKQKIAWEGFVKCCQRTKPQSFPVLLQLPAPQLIEAFALSPDLRDPLKEHLLGYTDTQRAHVPQAVQEVLLGAQTAVITAPKSPPAVAVILANQFDIPGVDSEPLPPGME